MRRTAAPLPRTCTTSFASLFSLPTPGAHEVGQDTFFRFFQEKRVIMTAKQDYAPGTFCWVELATTDATAAKAFYAELLGWSFSDQPVGEGMVYSMLQPKGKDMAALYELNEEMRSKGIPPHWMSYVSVSSADGTTTKATSLGGRVLKDTFEVFDVGRMTVLEAPHGTFFSIWRPRKHIGARLVSQGLFTGTS